MGVNKYEYKIKPQRDTPIVHMYIFIRLKLTEVKKTKRFHI